LDLTLRVEVLDYRDGMGMGMAKGKGNKSHSSWERRVKWRNGMIKRERNLG